MDVLQMNEFQSRKCHSKVYDNTESWQSSDNICARTQPDMRHLGPVGSYVFIISDIKLE